MDNKYGSNFKYSTSPSEKPISKYKRTDALSRDTIYYCSNKFINKANNCLPFSSFSLLSSYLSLHFHIFENIWVTQITPQPSLSWRFIFEPDICRGSRKFEVYMMRRIINTIYVMKYASLGNNGYRANDFYCIEFDPY